MRFFFPHPQLKAGKGYQIVDVFGLLKRTAAIQLGEFWAEMVPEEPDLG